MKIRSLKTSPVLAGFLGVAIMALSGCGSNLKPVSQSVNNLSYDPNAPYVQANQASTVTAQVVPATPSNINSVTVAPPAPAASAPNKPAAPTVQTAQTAQTPQTPQQIVASMNQQATQLPAQSNFFNSTMTYDFSAGSIYTVYCAPLNLTDIALQSGEKIISIAAGDTLRWQISQTYSGSLATGLTQHILVKPNSPNLTNSLFITTDHRVYHLMLQSVDQKSYMVSVNFHYESDPLTFVNNQDQGYNSNNGAAAAPTSSPFQLDLSRLDFNYQFGTVKGDKPSWYPTRVFNDGRQTFIEFPADFYNSDLPVLYVATTPKTYGTMMNWRLKGRYMVIDGVIQNARLESGVSSKDDQVIVQIQHS